LLTVWPGTITAFADCARTRTLTVTFACRDLSRAMNACMAAYATQAEHDRAREEWFAGRMERAREREMKEKRKLQQEKFLREWWGLPDRDPEEIRREEEKMARGERIGGWRSGTQGQAQTPSSSSSSRPEEGKR
jgi:COX assembly mitochondrial protein 1